MPEQTAASHQHISAQLMSWYIDMGVDEVLDKNPVNWFEQSKVRAKQQQPQHTSLSNSPQVRASEKNKPRNFSTLPPDSAVNEAREHAKNAQSLEELEGLIRKFEGCGLKATAKNTCVYRGAKDARLMMIGEAPGRDEDIQGVPFVGKAGQLLDKMLASIGRNEENTYITNIVYWRPPGNRTPTPQEAQVCLPFLEKQIELISPDVIVFLGGAAAKHMLNTTEGIMRLRGKWKSIEVNGKTFKAIATLHPAYLLRTPAGKKLAWKDFLAIKHAVETSN